MLLFWISLLVALIGSNAEGEFCVLHSPESLAFIRTGETWESYLKEIFSAALGLSIEYNTEWEGMYVMDPFATPEAVVEVHVDGVPSLNEYLGMKTKVFPLIVDANEPHTFKGIQTRIKQQFSEGRNKIVNVKLSDEKRHLSLRRAFGISNITTYQPNPTLKLIHLNEAVEEDSNFLKELWTLQTIIEKAQDGAITPDNIIDFYNFRFRTLHVLSDFYGPTSIQTKEAKQFLGAILQELKKVFVNAYDGSVLVTVVTTDVAHTRRSARSVTNPPVHSQKWPFKRQEPPVTWQNSLKPEASQKYSIPVTPLSEKFTPETTPSTKQYRRQEPEPGNESGNEDPPPASVEDSGGAGGDEPPPASGEDSGDDNGDESDEEPYASPEISESYAIFNIFLWFGVSIGFSMLAIVYTCMDMDPGRDTIIYRLTTMRIKKEV